MQIETERRRLRLGTLARNVREAALTSAILLAIGAALNVGVAWTLAGLGVLPTTLTSNHVGPIAEWLPDIPPGWPGALMIEAGIAFGVTETRVASAHYDHLAPQLAAATQNTIRYGLPLRSMYIERHGVEPLGRWKMRRQFLATGRFRDGVAIPARRAPMVAQHHPRLFPTRILPEGFVLNTIVYAVLAWFAWGVFDRIRVGIRTRRGLCDVCGHSLEGRAVCPGCGRYAMKCGDLRPLTPLD